MSKSFIGRCCDTAMEKQRLQNIKRKFHMEEWNQKYDVKRRSVL